MNWNTAREINTREFIIQRSTDNGVTWSDIGTEAAAGSSSFNQHYHFTDGQPKTENWYRLKMVDIDNAYNYSKVVILTSSGANTIYYTLYPNPADNILNVASTSFQSQKITISLIDNTGRVISREETIISNAAPAHIPVASYKAGMYYMIINDGNRSVKQKIVIAGR